MLEEDKMQRSVSRVVSGANAVDGAGVKLVRVLGHGTTEDFDPFLMLDAFDSINPDDYIRGFPWHPHRGIETVTYLIKGSIEHQDSLKNKGTIHPGSCQWMSAGSGIMHQEMPQEAKRMLGLQLWLNMPAKRKMTSPKYHPIESGDVPEVNENGAQVRVISGAYKGTKGAMQAEHVKMTMLDIALDPGAAFQIETPDEVTLVLYLFSGDGHFGEPTRQVGQKNAVLFTKGSEISFTAGDKGLRAMLFLAKPLYEPIAWGGPIVMNTKEELRQAFDELDRGEFIKS